MTMAGAIPRGDRRGVLARVFLVAAALTVLSYGSASTIQTNLAALAFAALAASAIVWPSGASGVARVQAIAVVLIAALLAYAYLQTIPLPGLANPAWNSATEALGPAARTISVAPGMTRDALSALALPFLAFIAALSLFQGDDEALLLWRALAYFGAGYAAFAIAQDVFLPEQILFEPKRFYVGYLTGSFINRNTAGTFFGVAFLLNLGLVFFYLRKIRLRSLMAKAASFEAGWRDKHGLLAVHALLCALTAVALFLTQSRGAVGATFVATILAAVLMLMRKLTADKESDAPRPWRRYAVAAGGLIAIIGLFALFAGRSTYRMAEEGGDAGRWCAYGSTIDAIRDNWLLGTGFGAFQDVFPVYRDSDCTGIFGVWERAHDVFLEGYLGVGAPFALVVAVGYLTLIIAFVCGLSRRRRYRFVPAMGLCALTLASLHSIVDFSLQIPGLAVYFAAVMASAATISLARGAE
jgi:O-antigen ligase